MLGFFNCCQKKKKINSSKRESVVLMELVDLFLFLFFWCVKLLWICLWRRFSSNRSQVDKCQHSAAGIVPFIQNSSASRGDVSSPVSGVKYFLTPVRLQKATAVLFDAETSVTMSSSGMLLLLSALLLHSARAGCLGKVTSRLWRRDQKAGGATLKELSHKCCCIFRSHILIVHLNKGCWLSSLYILRMMYEQIVFFCFFVLLEYFLFFASTGKNTSCPSDSCLKCSCGQTDGAAQICANDSMKGIKSCNWFIFWICELSNLLVCTNILELEALLSVPAANRTCRLAWFI